MPSTFEPDEPRPRVAAPFVALVLLEAALAPFAVVLGLAVGRNPLAAFDWDDQGAAAGLAATLPLIGGLWLAWRTSFGPLERVKAFLERGLVPALRGRGWPDLALLSVAAGVGEEMLFRGAIQGALGDRLGPAAGLALASLLFGLFHPVSPTYVLLAGLLGAYLGGVWLLTGNLLAAIVTHAVYDFVALLAIMAQGRPADHRTE